MAPVTHAAARKGYLETMRGCRYCTIQFCLVSFKALSIRIWQEENQKGNIRGKGSLSEQERMNHS